MKRLKIFTFVSIDGYSSRINGDMDWVPTTDEKNPFEQYGMPTFMETIDTVVMNRMQSILLQSHTVNWPIGDRTCYVLAYRGQPMTMPAKGLGIRALTLDDTRGPLERIRDIQLMGGKGHIWVLGDHRLTAYLLQYDMIDEINIVRVPVLLGSGLSFFGDFGIETRWNVESYNKFDNGAMHVKYGKSLSEMATA